MAFIRKARGEGWNVHHGLTGEILQNFRGRDAKTRASREMGRLHREHNPESENRGQRAERRDRMRDDGT